MHPRPSAKKYEGGPPERKTMKNPNAAVAGTSGGLSVFVVWLLGRFHVALSAEEGAVIAGVAASVVLFVGRNGIGGVWGRIMHGNKAPAKP